LWWGPPATTDFAASPAQAGSHPDGLWFPMVSSNPNHQARTKQTTKHNIHTVDGSEIRRAS